MPFESIIEQNNDAQKTMNKEHKIHYNTSASNCNIIILFVMLKKKINLLAFSGNNAIEEVKIVDRFSESINRDSPSIQRPASFMPIYC